jgi:ribosome biogenesis protein BRX1
MRLVNDSNLRTNLTSFARVDSLVFKRCVFVQIWVRNYQILEQQPTNALEAHLSKKKLGQEEASSLVEIGPRFVMNPIRIFRGSFGGQTLFQNPDFVSPNEIRSIHNKRKNTSYVHRKDSEKKRKIRKEELVVPEDPLDSVFR